SQARPELQSSTSACSYSPAIPSVAPEFWPEGCWAGKRECSIAETAAPAIIHENLRRFIRAAPNCAVEANARQSRNRFQSRGSHPRGQGVILPLPSRPERDQLYLSWKFLGAEWRDPVPENQPLHLHLGENTSHRHRRGRNLGISPLLLSRPPQAGSFVVG